MNRTCETYQNRETDEVVGYMSGGCNSKTLSGCEVADEWKIGNNFKHLIANEEFLFDALVKKVALSEYYEQIILMKLNMEDLPSSFRGLKAIVVDGKPPDIVFVEKDSWFSREYGIFNIWQLDWKQNSYMLKIPQMILLATNISNAEFNKFSYLSCLEFLCLRIIYYFDKFVNLLSDI
ncbi:hypothetical protein Ahy_A08g039794 [Arachis hypogaea]|uniref:AHK4/CRE1/WOL first receiver domain-containing protein n=1 Tax=Arachis hypogaea TaxID=3818 RepID=A0A445BXW8_ARAHY|nr:hypothetical protein Ahy_A08g039794 [Arachis hypogaea]